MRATYKVPSTDASPPQSVWRMVFKVLGIFILTLTAAAAGAGFYLHGKFVGEQGLAGIAALPKTVFTLFDPRSEFPSQDRITVLCLGLDRNIFRSKDPKLNGMPYTKDARTDVMMLASLDLKDGSVSVLSIPRDTRVRLPGRRHYSKINDAHARGGIPYTIETVEEFLGVDIDYHVVIKQEAIEKVVDALGGVELRVEKDMDYDDNWGQLHIHLKEGEQRLNGEQVVGYMRFRHDAEGDFGRIRRQQQVIQTLSQSVKSPSVLLKASGLIDAIREHVKTDLTARQQLALAHLFHRIDPAKVATISLPIAGTATIDEIAYVVPDDEKKEAVVDWIVHGDPNAMNRLIRVELKNASGSPALYQRVYRYLRHSGFEVWRAGRASDQFDTTKVVQRTNLRGSGRRVLETLGVGGNVEKLEEGGPDITLYVGKDLRDNPVVAFADEWEDLPDARRTARADLPDLESGERRERRRKRRREEPVMVKIRSADPEVSNSASDAGMETPAPDEAGVEPAPEVPRDLPPPPDDGAEEGADEGTG